VVVYEAMAGGLPVVTPIRNTAIPEVLTENEAYFVADAADPGSTLRFRAHPGRSCQRGTSSAGDGEQGPPVRPAPVQRRHAAEFVLPASSVDTREATNDG